VKTTWDTARKGKLIPNYKIDEKLKTFESFENYNRTITAVRNGSLYSITHWDTVILNYDVDTSEILFFRSYFISNTTSKLVGRLIRAFPQETFDRLLERQRPQDRPRLMRMRKGSSNQQPEIIYA
jgi:hypothetical protein